MTLYGIAVYLIHAQFHRDKAVFTFPRGYMSDEAYAKLQRILIETPDAGDVIPGSAGIRKLRWKGAGRGKHGGIRVIYHARSRQDEIWLLTLYGKAVSENISAHVLKKIKDEIDGQNETPDWLGNP